MIAELLRVFLDDPLVRIKVGVVAVLSIAVRICASFSPWTVLLAIAKDR
jgi:hypothetical protein